MEPLCRDAERAARGDPRRRSLPPRHPRRPGPLRLRSALPASLLARAVFRGGAGARLLRGARAHSILPLSRLPSAAFGLVLGAARPLGGLAARARRARRRSPTRSPPTCARSGARSRPAARCGSLAELDGRRHRAARRHASPAPVARAASGCRAATAVASSATATAPACSSSTGRSTRRSPGGTRTAPGRRPSTSAARWRRSPPRSGRPWRGETVERPFVLLAQQSLFDPTRAPAGQAHRLGLLPRPERLGRRHDRADRGSGRALRARVPRPHPGPQRDGTGRAWRRTTRTTSAGTSTAAPPTCPAAGAAGRSRARRTRRRCRACSSALPRPRRAAACTGCAASSPPRRRCAGSPAPESQTRSGSAGARIEACCGERGQARGGTTRSSARTLPDELAKPPRFRGQTWRGRAGLAGAGRPVRVHRRNLCEPARRQGRCRYREGPTMPAPARIEFLFFADCPSHAEALELLRSVLAASAGSSARSRSTRCAATRRRAGSTFPGSPTIRIDGRDVDPAGAPGPAGAELPYLPAPDGRVSPLPSREQIEEALR